MATEKFVVTAEIRSVSRNSTKFLSALAFFCLAAALFAPFLFLNTPEKVTGPHNAESSVANFTSNPTTVAQVREAYGQMSLSFEANRGQADQSVDFVARGAGYTLTLSPTVAAFRLQKADCGLESEALALAGGQEFGPKSSKQSATCNPQSTMLRMNLLGANQAATVAGQNKLDGRVNYFIGNDPSKWRTDVPTFGRVRYSEVYTGIDVVYYGNQKRLEYDFVVAPGSDVRAIALKFDGAKKVEVDAATGDLLVQVGNETIRQHAPVTYQQTADGGRREIESHYVLQDGVGVGFDVGEYDRSAPLVIDPVLVYSSYLGGSGTDVGVGIAVDSAGNAYVTGRTDSTNFPTVNPIDNTHNGNFDVFVTKINPAGTALVYSTYLGGSGLDEAIFIALDSAGNAYVTGDTASANFPTVNPIDGALSGNRDAFVTKINATGTALVYSTYLGGSGDDFGYGIAVDSAANAYFNGTTRSTNFPTVNPIDATLGGDSDAFVTKINAAGTALIYSTYVGGSVGGINNAAEDFARGIAVDSAGNLYAVGGTRSTDFPTANPIQGTKGANLTSDAFVTKINAAGTAFLYSTYLGGNGTDVAQGIAVDSAGNAYVAGDTASSNFPAVNPIDTDGPFTDAFVTKINAAGTALIYSTYLSGESVEGALGIAVDSASNAYVTGVTFSTDFPTVNPIAGTHDDGVDGVGDAFITKITAAGAFVYSTYLGGNDDDEGFFIALDSAGNAYVTGLTRSSCFPTTVGAFDTTHNGGEPDPFGASPGGSDAFITKISETAPPSPVTPIISTVQFAQASYTVAEDVTFVTAMVTRTGDTSASATVDFATTDAAASERRDYTTALGTLRFAAGETSKTIDLLVNEDRFVEGTETFIVTLSNPTGAACLGVPSTAVIQITDDASEPSTNVIDDAGIFVGTHYHDFLNRQADASGLNFWTNDITICGSNDACIDHKRTNVSQAFFLSIEFQQTGYLVFRFYKETFTDSLARPRGMPRYREFLRDTQEIGRGIVVGVGDWETKLETNKQDFALRWVQKPEFIAEFPVSMTAAQFVDKLFLNAETAPTTAERNTAIAAFGVGDAAGRAAALRSAADSGSLYNRQFNPAFVLMQYIGYLRRNPNDAPEAGLDYAGFDFWLNKMNQFSLPGEDVRNELVARARAQRAEMVRAFILSTEYRGRFGP